MDILFLLESRKTRIHRSDSGTGTCRVKPSPDGGGGCPPEVESPGQEHRGVKEPQINSKECGQSWHGVCGCTFGNESGRDTCRYL